ncbi:TonB-dependent receptor [Sphingomonas crocodyli]|nr:TonB-dependent receptor [Sphingomonas crocodyli]
MRGWRACAFLTSASLLAIGSAASAQDVAPQATSGLEDIVVTAQKREQNLQDVPVSITAISENALVANRIVNIQDLNSAAPNLTIRQATGGTLYASYTIRGLYAQGALTGQDRGVALYIDGVYLGNANGAIFELADISRIEVLRGPQGTLFGRNATGGAISLITRDPSGDFGVRQELSYGNRNYIRSKTRVDLPAWGPLAVSATYTHSEQRGDTRNLGAGTKWDYTAATGGRTGILTSPKWLGSNNTEAVAFSAKLEASDNLDISYKFDFTQNNYTPYANGQAYLPAAGLGAIYNAPGRVVNPSPVTTKRPDGVNNWFTTPSQQTSYGHNLTLVYRLNDEITFKNILARRYNKIDPHSFQFDGLGGILAAPNATTLPLLISVISNGNTQKQWSNESQINIDTDWFKLTAGYFHFHDNNKVDQFLGVRASASGIVAPNYVIPLPPANLPAGAPTCPLGVVRAGCPGQQVVPGISIVNSDAFFVQPEFKILDNLDLVLGARLTIDRKKGAFRGLAFAPYRNSKPTYLAGLNYKFDDDTLIYGKYVTGYISGGNYFGIEYGEETSSSWEAGFKTELFDRRLRSNLALFSVKYGNLQQTLAGQQVGRPDLSSIVLNAGNAKAKGFEWENTLVPVDGLTLTASVGYTDFNYVDGTLNASQFPAGQRPRAVYRPKWSLNTAIEYLTPPVFGDAQLLARVDANYKTREYFRSVDNPTLLAAPDPGYLAGTEVGPRWLANARLALRGVEVAGSKVEIGLWGKNIFNNKDLTYVSGIYTFNPATYERERSYGIDLNFQF